jgi:hypothetical protein
MRQSTCCALFTLSAALLASGFCSAQSMPAASPAASDAAKPVLMAVTRFEDNFTALAQAIPADKYNFAPSPDVFKAGSPEQFATVRTVAQELTHVAGEAFRGLAAFGVKPDPAIDLKSIDSLTSKDEILKVLQASFDYQNKVIATMTPETAFTPTGPRNTNLVATLISILNDDGDHYGQLVEYGRMNGIIPPATERQMQRTPAPAQK